MVLETLISQARNDVDSWMGATAAASRLARPEHQEVLGSLSRSREQSIRAHVARLSQLANQLDALETQRVTDRTRRRKLIAARDQASPWGNRRTELTHQVDAMSEQLMEVERRRAETIAEAARTASTTVGEAKALYAQVSALAGMGRIDSVPGMIRLDPASTPANGPVNHHSNSDETTRGFQHG